MTGDGACSSPAESASSCPLDCASSASKCLSRKVVCGRGYRRVTGQDKNGCRSSVCAPTSRGQRDAVRDARIFTLFSPYSPDHTHSLHQSCTGKCDEKNFHVNSHIIDIRCSCACTRLLGTQHTKFQGYGWSRW